MVSINFVDSLKNFLSGCTNNKSKLGLVTPSGLPGEAVESFLGYTRLYIGVLAKVLFRCRAFFGLFFAVCDNLLRLSSPGELPRVRSSY